MFLALDPDEQAIADAAERFLGGEFPLERLHGDHRDGSRLGEFARLGWLGLSAPEAIGGSGLGAIEEMLFFLALGRVAGPFDVLPQSLAVVTTAADAALRGSLLRGEAQVALLVERRPGEGVRIVGDAAARYVLEVTPDSATLFELDASACRPVPCLDRSVTMRTAPDSALARVLQREGGMVWRRGQLELSALLVGTAERALDMIVAYAKVRHTFGRPIGAYQAVRHPCADMAVRVEAARSQLYYAATALQQALPDAAAQVDAARLLADRAARANTDANIQLHGGIGVTEEFSAHLLLKRANLLWRLFGSSRRAVRSLLEPAGEGAQG